MKDTVIWARLIAVKHYREGRLRAEISRLKAQLLEVNGALEEIDRQRIEGIRQWRARSEQTFVHNTEGLRKLRREFGNCYFADQKRQQEKKRLQGKRTTLQQQGISLNTILRQCIVKQEKLRLISQRQR